MNEKLRSLRELRASVEAGRLTGQQKAQNCIADTDGRHVRLGDHDILDVIDRRIAAEEPPTQEPPAEEEQQA